MKRIILSIGLLLGLSAGVCADPLLSGNLKIYDDGVLIDNATLSINSTGNIDNGVYISSIMTVTGNTNHFSLNLLAQDVTSKKDNYIRSGFNFDVMETSGSQHSLNIVITDPFADFQPLHGTSNQEFVVIQSSNGLNFFDWENSDTGSPSHMLTTAVYIALAGDGSVQGADIFYAFPRGLPEPSTLVLLAIGALCLTAYRFRVFLGGRLCCIPFLSHFS